MTKYDAQRALGLVIRVPFPPLAAFFDQYLTLMTLRGPFCAYNV